MKFVLENGKRMENIQIYLIWKSFLIIIVEMM